MVKPWIFMFLMLLVSLLSGCETYLKYAEYEAPYSEHGDWLCDHRASAVKYPAFTGRMIGFWTGIPLILPWAVIGTAAAIPVITFESAIASPNDQNKKRDSRADNRHNMEVLFAPPILLSAAGKYSLGVPCWTLFGWWWPEQNAEQHKVPAEKKPEPPSTGTAKKETHLNGGSSK